MNSCSYDEQIFQEADELCEKLIAPFFQKDEDYRLESFITTTIKLYKEVEYMKDNILGDKLKLHYSARKTFAENVMRSWIDKHPDYRSIVAAICYDMTF